MADQWHYRIFGEEFGPVPESTLRDLVANGTLGPSDEIRREANSDWQTADALPPTNEPVDPSSDPTLAVDLDSMLAAPTPKRQSVPADSGDGGEMDLDAMLAPSTPKAQRKAESAEWFYRVGGRKFGPVDFDTLFEHAAQGRFSRYDEIRGPGEDDWVEAQSLVGLFSRDEPDLDALLGEEKPLRSAPAAPKPKPVKETWYYRVLNQEMGPVDFDALFDLVVEGNLRPDDDIRSSGESQWHRADSLVGLFPDDMLESSQAAPEDETSEIDDGDAEWYLQRNGQVAGPVTFGRLVDMAAKGQLQRKDEIRLTKLGAWMEADSMVGLFPEEPEVVEKPEPKAAPAESNVPRKPTGDADDWAAAVLSEPGAEPERPKPQYDAQPAYVPTPAAGAPGGMGAAAPSRPAFKPPPKSSRRSSGGGISLPSGLGSAVANPIVLAVVGLVVLGGALSFVPWGTIFAADSSDLIAQLDEIWGQTKALYEKEAADGEWTSLESQVGPKLTEIAQTATDRGAGPSNPGLQIAHMLASKHIPKVLSEKSEASDVQVRTVDNFLARAQEL